MIEGTWCAGCAVGYVPPLVRCTSCGVATEARAWEPVGELETFTTVHQPPHGFEGGFTVGVVRLAPGVRVAAHWTGAGALRVGERARLMTGPDLMRFEPASGA